MGLTIRKRCDDQQAGNQKCEGPSITDRDQPGRDEDLLGLPTFSPCVVRTIFGALIGRRIARRERFFRGNVHNVPSRFRSARSWLKNRRKQYTDAQAEQEILQRFGFCHDTTFSPRGLSTLRSRCGRFVNSCGVRSSRTTLMWPRSLKKLCKFFAHNSLCFGE